MKLLQLLLSLLSHLGVALLLCLPKSQAPKEKVIEVHKLTEQELQKLVKRFREDQVVNNDPNANKKKAKTLEKVYLSKNNNSAKKNTTVKKNDEFIQGQDGFGSAPKSISQKGKFKPSKKGKGVSATDDFILGADIGPMTILNSQEFKYFSYYDRVKKAVTENWRPLIRKAIKQVKADPKQFGVLEVRYYTTQLEVRLDSRGELIDIKFLGISGQEKFDQAAAEAFRKTKMFTSPPKELVKDGLFTLRWDFSVSVDSESMVGVGGGQIF